MPAGRTRSDGSVTAPSLLPGSSPAPPSRHLFRLGVVRAFQGLGLAHLGGGDLLEVHGAVRGVEPVDHRQEQGGDAEA